MGVLIKDGSVDCSGSGKGQVVRACKCGDEPSRTIGCGKFPD